ncbi:MAG TPA: extracellular solute-binding protein, partial [Limnochordia bacterium]|nr:extracellular solute-binding protein [Limnochordia bacterium]
MKRRIRIAPLVAGLVGAAAMVVSASAGAKTTIRFATWEDSGNKANIAAFEAAHPDIDVEYTLLDWDGWTAYEQQISIWVASGVAPDVVLIPYYALPALVESDALLPVDDLIERDGAGFGYDDFVSVAKQATQWDQKTWGLPYDLSLWWNNYNADAFADAGTADPGQLLDAGNWT